MQDKILKAIADCQVMCESYAVLVCMPDHVAFKDAQHRLNEHFTGIKQILTLAPIVGECPSADSAQGNGKEVAPAQQLHSMLAQTESLVSALECKVDQFSHTKVDHVIARRAKLKASLDPKVLKGTDAQQNRKYGYDRQFEWIPDDGTRSKFIKTSIEDGNADWMDSETKRLNPKPGDSPNRHPSKSIPSLVCLLRSILRGIRSDELDTIAQNASANVSAFLEKHSYSAAEYCFRLFMLEQICSHSHVRNVRFGGRSISCDFDAKLHTVAVDTTGDAYIASIVNMLTKRRSGGAILDVMLPAACFKYYSYFEVNKGSDYRPSLSEIKSCFDYNWENKGCVIK